MVSATQHTHDLANSGTATPVSETIVLQKTCTNPSPYYSLPLGRKCLILFLLSFTTLSASFSSTSLFPAVPEISRSLNTTQWTIDITNAAVVFTMGCSNFVWGPIDRTVGRKNAYLGASLVFVLTTIGTALVRTSKGFVALRVLSAVQGTYFHITGQALLAQIFEPTYRGTATGFFLAGTVFGPPFGPCIGGIIMTFTTWRAILWLQAAMMGVAVILAFFFLPDIPRQVDILSEKADINIFAALKQFNCLPTFKTMAYPNVLFTDLTCGFLSWSQYTLLAAPRFILLERFNIDSPLVSGLFYISPGVGFLVGTVVGGKYSDIVVRKWIKKRAGLRLPQDRLNSGMFAYFLLIPATSLIYGWVLQCEVGGLALPIVLAFFDAAGLLIVFASVNTYCAEVLPKQRTEVIAGKYFIQYTFAAIGSAAIVPLMDSVGIGPASTIGTVLVLFGGILTAITARYGFGMQQWVERRPST